MGKRNMDNIDKDNLCSNDASNTQPNENCADDNINRSDAESEFQEPFIIQESEKQIDQGEKQPQKSVPSEKASTANQTQEAQEAQSGQNTITDNISSAANLLENLNTIKEDIIKLPLNPAEKDYMDVYVFPLLNVLLDLSTTSLNLSSTTSKLAVSYVTTPKISKLKDTEHLVYDINDKCEDVYKVLKQRINFVLKCIDKIDKCER